MTTAGDNPLYGQFDAMLDSIINPRGSGRSSGVICCADLYCGDGEANHAAFIAGTKVTYAYTTSDDEAEKYLDDFYIEPFTGSTGDSVRMAPEFDLLLVQIGEDALAPPQVQPFHAVGVGNHRATGRFGENRIGLPENGMAAVAVGQVAARLFPQSAGLGRVFQIVGYFVSRQNRTPV